MFARNAIIGSLASKLLSRQVVRQSANNLYTPAALGVNGYDQARKKFQQQFLNLQDKFKTKMTEFCGTETGTVFTEDLKHMVHLAEGGDLGLVKQMLLKYAAQNKDLRFGSFIFGPVVMRMYHHLNAPTEALDAFNDPGLDGFFDQLVTFQILMDLLLVNGRYDDVVAVFEKVVSKQLQGAKYPKNCVVLTFAALYKKNTKDAQDYSKKLWSQLNSVGHYPMRRAATFAAALSIAQGEPGVAIEILTTVQRQSYVTVRNLKVSALADLGRPDDALPILRSTLEFRDTQRGGSGPEGHTYCKETLDKMETAVEKMNSKELTDEFQAIHDKLKGLNLVVNSPLDEQLCIDIEQFQHRNTDSDRYTGQRDRYTREPYNKRPSRPGGGPYRPGVMNLV